MLMYDFMKEIRLASIFADARVWIFRAVSDLYVPCCHEYVTSHMSRDGTNIENSVPSITQNFLYKSQKRCGKSPPL